MEALAMQIGQAVRAWFDDPLPRKFRKALRGDVRARAWLEERAARGDGNAARALADLDDLQSPR